ncbi:hypothetical protein HG15A2_24420 [Adhaeretor mobilis]|uniref:Uncharacterized protein n=1 Tax=Adhaeretor mobilis TaxID=1930276 RepID=A0A517MW93_9BACT|nr:hypothetical protein HG15A2_24420 [Adhaeretor mobilis]
MKGHASAAQATIPSLASLSTKLCLAIQDLRITGRMGSFKYWTNSLACNPPNMGRNEVPSISVLRSTADSLPLRSQCQSHRFGITRPYLKMYLSKELLPPPWQGKRANADGWRSNNARAVQQAQIEMLSFGAAVVFFVRSHHPLYLPQKVIAERI